MENNKYPVYGTSEMSKMNQDTNPVMNYQMVYPEIFYRLQPYIMMVCDQMDLSNIEPNMDMVQQITDNIYDDVVKMYPDMAEYARNNENETAAVFARNTNDDPPPFGPGMFNRRFRRRGLFRDIIDILLLSELFRRRRRPY